MSFFISRYLALLFAIGLGIGETIISWGRWQFAPLWIIDYFMVVLLLYAFYKTGRPGYADTLLSAWAFTAGVFYMDLFVNLDPQLPPSMQPGRVLLALITLMLVLSLIGFFSALFAVRAKQDPAAGATASAINRG